MKKKCIITARDYGAAVNIIEIVRYFQQFPEIEITLLASNPAYDYFIENKIKCLFIQSEDIINKTKEVLLKVKPDVILTSLSGFSPGIDEYILSLNNEAKTYCLQDYWGDINLSLNVTADKYFVIDTYAKYITKSRIDVDIIVLNGLPKYISYEKKIFTVDKPSKKKKIVFFGQPLWHLEGYTDSLKSIKKAISFFSKEIQFCYKIHPAEKKNIKAIKSIFSEYVHIIEGGDNIDLFLNYDLTLSINSTSNMDKAYLNKYTQSPQGINAYLIINEEMKDFFYSNFFEKKHPLVEKDIIYEANTFNELFELLIILLNSIKCDKLKNKQWLAANKNLNKANSVLDIIKDEIYNTPKI